MLAGKSHQNNMVDVKEEISPQANFLLLFLKRRHCQLQNRRKHRFILDLFKTSATKPSSLSLLGDEEL